MLSVWSPFARCSGTFGADVSEFGGFLFEFLASPSYAWCSLATVRHHLINGALMPSHCFM
eukprot:scaffold29619_cov63-Attheya_sp.AAC.8